MTDPHKNIRRKIVAAVIVWISAAVGVGLWRLTELDAQANVFLLAVLGLLTTPVAYYFYQKGKE